MYTLFTDETNVSPKSDIDIKFFVYGGLIVPTENLPKLHREVELIRNAIGLKPDEEFKFNSRTRPEGLDTKTFADAKNKVVELAIEAGCQFIACLVHHDIAKQQGTEKLILFSANTVVAAFNRFLLQQSVYGEVIIDRLPGGIEYDYIVEKFTKGLIFPKSAMPLERIVMFAASCSGASYASSVADIVLGSFRYCINSPPNIVAAKKMMTNLASIFLARRDGKKFTFKKLGFSLDLKKCLRATERNTMHYSHI